MFRRSLGYLRHVEHPVRTVLVGSVLLYYGRTSVLPSLFVMGYVVRVIRHEQSWAPEGEPAADSPTPTVDDRDTTGDRPTFDRWVDLFVTGVQAQLVWFVYVLLVPFVVTVLLQQGAIDPGEATKTGLSFLLTPFTVSFVVAVGSALGSTGALTGLLGRLDAELVQVVVSGEFAFALPSLEPLVLFVGALYVYPAALSAFAETGDIRAAFRVRTLRSRVVTLAYAISWLQFVSLWALSIVVAMSPRIWGSVIFPALGDVVGPSYLLRTQANELVVVLSAVVGFVLLVAAYVALTTDQRTSARPTVRAALDRLSTRLRLSDSSLVLVVAGGILLSLGNAFGAVLVAGYLVSVLHRTVGGDDSLPEITDWVQLGRDGLRATGLWIGAVSLPLTVLLLGQDTGSYDTSLSPAVRTLVNGVVGLQGVTFLAPLAYLLDFLVSDLLVFSDVPARAFHPWSVGDPSAVPPLVWLGFGVTLLSVWYVFPAVLTVFSAAPPARRRLTRLNRRVVWRVLGAAEYRRAWVRVLPLWLLATGAHASWYLWRRHARYVAIEREVGLAPDVTTVVVEPFGVEFPVPTTVGLITAPFLLVVATVSFACLVSAYATVGRACRSLVDDSGSQADAADPDE